MRPQAYPQRRGFTLIELLVVIAIIAVLIGLLLPAVQKVREAAARSKCQNNLKQLTLALHMYHDVNNCLPNSWKAYLSTAVGQNTRAWGWASFILPYVEQGALYDALQPGFNPANGSNNPANAIPLPTTQPLLQQPVKLFRCPSDDGPDVNPFYMMAAGSAGLQGLTTSNYTANEVLFNNGPNFPPLLNQPRNVTTWLQVTDGTTNTLCLAERALRLEPVGKRFPGSVLFGRNGVDASQVFGPCWPPNTPLATGDYTVANGALVGDAGGGGGKKQAASSMHSGGCMFSFCDGSVRFINENIPYNPACNGQGDGGEPQFTGPGFVYNNLYVHNDGNVIAATDY
jgi:prepilin-type N-terminal cleavage/methylation domain-containing protein/prepilin-type processing-associated H-X9-DG protein